MKNKKSLLHIITVVSFAVFIVLGLACGTMEPQTASAQSGTQWRQSDWEAFFDRTEMYEKNGNYDLAVEEITEAIRVTPSNYNPAPLYNWRAWIYAYHLKTNFDLALADVNQALRIEPNDKSYLDTRGWVYLGMGDYNRAIDDFNKALQLDKNLESSKEGLKKVRELQAEEVIDWSQFE